MDTHYNAHRYSADLVTALIGRWIPFFELCIAAHKSKNFGQFSPSKGVDLYAVLKISHQPLRCRGSQPRELCRERSADTAGLVGGVWVKTCL